MRWATFLATHREAIAAMDFFTMPTFTFGVLYGFFVIAHDRRRILHFNVTRHPILPRKRRRSQGKEINVKHHLDD
jgi:hypothetical protein